MILLIFLYKPFFQLEQFNMSWSRHLLLAEIAMIQRIQLILKNLKEFKF